MATYGLTRQKFGRKSDTNGDKNHAPLSASLSGTQTIDSAPSTRKTVDSKLALTPSILTEGVDCLILLILLLKKFALN